MTELLTGQTESHLAPWGALKIHRGMVVALNHLTTQAREAGFALEVASAFRGFQAQLKIWNEKARGLRPLLDNQGKALDFSKLSPEEIVFSILRWSALPGASRHHWGTDIDVFDKSVVPVGYVVRLTPEEVNPGGLFGPLHDWLDLQMKALGFYRPYARDLGGVSPERWHLSYHPLSGGFQKQLSVAMLQETLESTEMELKQVVLDRLEEIFERFVLRTSPF